MTILVDADACPVVGIVEKIAKEYKLPVMLFGDTNHVLSSDYSQINITQHIKNFHLFIVSCKNLCNCHNRTDYNTNQKSSECYYQGFFKTFYQRHISVAFNKGGI